MEMALLPSEETAKNFVTKYTVSRCSKVLDSIVRRFDRRYELACDEAGVPLNREWIYRTELESTLTHRIKLGMMILSTYDHPLNARIRNLKRISANGGVRAIRAKVALDLILVSAKLVRK
jgi:hypothetical protein